MRKWGKVIKALCLLLGCLMFCSCSKNVQGTEVLPASGETYFYEGTGSADNFTVDSEGILYTVQCQYEDRGPVLVSEYVYKPLEQQICLYDLEGNCIEKKMIAFGNGGCDALLVRGKVLYCIAFHGDLNSHVLFEIDLESWEVTELIALTGYQNIFGLSQVGEYFYILGSYQRVQNQEYVDEKAYVYSGNRISRINMNEVEPQLELMNVELPVAIYTTDKDTLMIYRYCDEKGFGFSEFDQVEMKIDEVGWRESDIELWTMGGCGDGYLCTQGEYLYYGTVDGKEAQVYPECVILNRPPVYQNGFAFFRDLTEERVCRICVADIVQNNEPIRFLMCEYAQDLPYGCGFQMEKNIVNGEEMALKILALDKDFDLFLLSSRESISDSIRKNGVFYPLNEVDGVEKYINACFPYLNELARNEEGDIWMIPVMLAIPGVVYNKQYCAENGVNLYSMDFAEFLEFTSKSKEETPEYTDISTYVCYEELFGQYLSKYDSFDTELFRKYAAKVKGFGQQEIMFHGKVSDSLSYTGAIVPGTEAEYPLHTQGKLPEFYYFYNVYSRILEALSRNLGMLEDIGMLGVPKLEEGIDNYGTLTFLAVNPQSENLEATLDYISAYARYMMTKQNSFLLADKSTYTDTPFMRDWYELYANGMVYFAVEGEVYLSIFDDYLQGNIDLETAIVEMERRRKLYLEE